jgi:hypothetical protein
LATRRLRDLAQQVALPAQRMDVVILHPARIEGVRAASADHHGFGSGGLATGDEALDVQRLHLEGPRIGMVDPQGPLMPHAARLQGLGSCGADRNSAYRTEEQTAHPRRARAHDLTPRLLDR